jgi:SM-20-related protein
MSFYTEDIYLKWIDQLAEDDYVIIDNFIPEELYSIIFSFFNERIAEDDLEKAGIGALGLHTVDKQVRGDYVYWINQERDLVLKELSSRVDELIEKIKRYCFLSISDFESHLAYYPAGTFYKKHLDQFKDRSNRILSFVLYLNPDWKTGDGGELIIHKEKEKIAISPLKTRLVLFKSASVLHEVALTNVPRYSVTGWMLNNPVGLGFL